jgi:DNA-binding NtrC family response regulator
VAERVLIVDDDPVQRRLLENMVSKSGFDPMVVAGGDAAVALLGDPAAPPIDCVVLDLVMPDLDGLGVLGRMREAGLSIPVIVQTAHGGIDNVVSAMRAGAFDFVVKPVGIERLQVSLTNALAHRALAGELSRIKRSRAGTLTFDDIVTRSERMRAVLGAAKKAAASHIPVLIQGESGVGKELVARAIHGSGERRTKAFVAVNCGAIPDALVESILFGHEKGAFTGASERHIGKFVEASGGTLFLDEVGELPPAAQVKLLRAIQDGEVEPVGARRPVRVDVRLMSATNRDLIADVSAGRFREDLFYRLHVFPITLPPLRERAEDIPDLIRHFLMRFSAEEGRRVRAVSAEAVQMLAAFAWPGNVRQLENAMFRAVVLAEGEELGPAEFPQIAAQMARGADNGPAVLPASVAPQEALGGEVMARIALAPPAAISPQAPRSMLPLLSGDGEVRRLDDVEADMIRFAVTHYRGQISEVARRLGIGRSTLYRKMQALGMAPALNGDAPNVAIR